MTLKPPDPFRWCFLAVAFVAACDTARSPDVDRGPRPHQRDRRKSNLSNIMLTAASAEEASVDISSAPSASSPNRIDFRRGLAASLVRAGRADEAVPLWRQIVESDEMMEQDRIDLRGGR